MPNVMKKNSVRAVLAAIAGILLAVFFLSAYADTYQEDFDSLLEGATIDGTDNWTVESGNSSDALVEDEHTYTGEGKALKLVGDEDNVILFRGSSYSSSSPTWIQFLVYPGIGSERAMIPAGKIAAVTFDYSGRVFATDGTDWYDTGYSFTQDQWYRVTLGLDFNSHTYDVYLAPYTGSEDALNNVASGLDFIDPTKSSLNGIGLESAYSTIREDDTSFIPFIVFSSSRHRRVL